MDMNSSEAGRIASEAADMNVTWLDSPALPLILKLASSRPADVAKLLSTSKAIHSAVLASCKGVTSVHVYYPRRQQADISVPTLITWIAKYGQLVGELCFAPGFCQQATVVGDQQRAAAEQALAASLQQAAVAGSSNIHPGATSSGAPGLGDRSGLQLHSCCLLDAGIDAVAVLQQLPGCSLTKLDLYIQRPNNLPDENPGDYLRCFSNSLTHLINLRGLRLGFSSHHSTNAAIDQILQQLSQLTNLRLLALEKAVPTNTALQVLPTFIEKLELSWKCDVGPSQLHLTHLTLLTSLTCWSRLPKDCLLPSSLVILRTTNLMHSACLRPLKALQKLELHQYTGADNNIQHMSVLTSLTHVQVAFRSLNNVDLSGCAWRVMPVRQLEISDPLSVYSRVAEQTVHHLGQLTQLTFLRLDCPIDSSPAAFAVVLQRLVQLKSLALRCLFNFRRPQADSRFFCHQTDNDKSSAIHVFTALASLHHLQTLRLQGLPIDYQAAQLTAALPTGQLKRLLLWDCSLGNSTLTAVLTAMPLAHLKELNVSNNFHVDDAVLSVVAGLPKLSKLVCYHTSITRSGCSQLPPHVEVYR